MANLHVYFKMFYDNLQIVKSKKDAITTSHNHLREVIQSNFAESHPGYNIDFWIQGSWKMKTTIRTKDDECDLDDGVYISPIPNVAGTTVQNWVFDAITGVTDSAPSHKNKCVRVQYKAGYHIDLPVYVMTDYKDKTECPQLAVRDSGYQNSNPKQLVEWFEANARNNEQLIRIISYLKAWCDDVPRVMPPGLALTILATNNQVKHDRDDVALLETVKAIRSSLQKSFTCKVPAEPYDNIFENMQDKKQRVLEELDRIIQYGDKAMDTKNLKKASEYWEKALGDRFPIAPDKDEDAKAHEAPTIIKNNSQFA